MARALVTEEKVVLYSSDNWTEMCNMRDALNKELAKGWKIKPATLHSTQDCTMITLYREIRHVEISADEED